MAGGYAGDLSPEDAMTILRDDPQAVLVDVRTRPEWAFVGLPDLSALNKEAVLIEWQTYPTMAQNPAFVSALKTQLDSEGAKADTPVLFLCRSGARSRAAAVALTDAGYTRCYNIAGGFEGAPDEDRHRGSTDGWKASGLPWAQS